MKRLLFLIFICLLTTSSGLATEKSIELRYCSETIRPFTVGGMAEIDAAVAIPIEIAKKYAGQHLTKIKIGLGNNRATDTKVFIRTGLDREPVYIQAADFEPSVWNVITLDEPYIIKGDEEFYFGYSLVTDIYGQDYAMGIDDSPVANPKGDWIRCKFTGEDRSEWLHIGEQGFSNLCIVGVVEGDKPERDVDLFSISAPSLMLDVNDPLSINGKLRNMAMEPVTGLEISYKMGDSEKRILSFTDIHVPPNATFDFNISDNTIFKEVDRSYTVEISVDKVNGGEDEHPEDNTRSTRIHVWKAPDSPTLVSTLPLKKNAIIEEFTGVFCVYCPDGHRIANEVVASHPERVSVINIHQGMFANANPNYTTQWGDAIANQTGIDGYPAGTINRHVFSGQNTILGRGNFSARTNTILNQDAYVNVALKASLNESSRELTVDVELYYTGKGSPVNMLNIALLQDSILGPQTGAEDYYPEMMIDGQYRHNHMLRDLLTQQWGDSIRQTAAGTFVAKRYLYAVPEKIGDIPVNLRKLEIVAFVAEGTQEIISGTSSKFNPIIYTGMPAVQAPDIRTVVSGGSLLIYSGVPVLNAAIYTVSGQKTVSMAPVNNRVPVGNLPPGIYIVQLQTGKGVKTVKIIR